MTMQLRNSPKKSKKVTENNELPKEETPRNPRDNESEKENEWTIPIKWAFDDQLTFLKKGFVPKDL